jgi:polynucleotide 5'-hydroxyl-kinase GRC3/NOL9
MKIDIPTSWQEALDRIIEARGVCMAVGPVDSGKTTFCSVLAHQALAAGVPVALVDADSGQSDIGPPACVGMAIIKKAEQLESMEAIAADALAFIGTTTPGGHLLPLAAAAADMVARAREARAELIIVDTTGLVNGGIGRALKAAKVDLLRPRHLVGMQKKDEVEHILAPYRERDEPRLYRVRPSRHAKSRNRDERKAKRERQFAAYFADARNHDLAWDQVGLEQTAWLTGDPVPGHIAAYVEELAEAEPLYTERIETGFFAIVRGLRGAAHRSIKGEETDVRVVDASLLENLLVGLIDATGNTLAMAILAGVDFKRRRFEIQAPLVDLTAVRSLRLGSVRVSPHGVELGHGEIA